MVDIKPILRIANVAQAASIAGEGIKLVRKKKKRVKDFLSYGTTAMVGSSLLQSQASFIEGV